MWRPPHGRPALHRLWCEQRGLFRGFVADVALSAGFGFLTYRGGREGTTGSAWAVVNANGGPTLWGLVFLVLAAVLALGAFTSPGTLAWLLRAAALIYMMLAIGFASAAFYADSNGVGALLLIYPAINYVLRAQAYLEGPQTTRAPRPWTA